MIIKNKLKTSLLFLLLLSACSVPKDILTKIESKPKEMVDFPIEYCIALPTQKLEQWDSDYELYDKFLTNEIMKTQLGMSYTYNGVQTWWCYPAVRTHTQLDTITIIKNSNEIIGDWRIICNRKILFSDSVVYADKNIYRNEKIIYNEKDADVFLEISDLKLKMYGTEKGKNIYKLGTSKNYSIINGRFLMLYGMSKASGAMSQIGIDKNGNLIVNTYMVQERKIKQQYITFESIVTQTIFKRQ